MLVFSTNFLISGCSVVLESRNGNQVIAHSDAAKDSIANAFFTPEINRLVIDSLCRKYGVSDIYIYKPHSYSWKNRVTGYYDFTRHDIYINWNYRDYYYFCWTFISELAHAEQWREDSAYYTKKIITDWLLHGMNLRNLYDNPSTAEFEAHNTIEPKLTEEYRTILTNLGGYLYESEYESKKAYDKLREVYRGLDSLIESNAKTAAEAEKMATELLKSLENYK